MCRGTISEGSATIPSGKSGKSRWVTPTGQVYECRVVDLGMADPPTVAVLGTGIMGAPMARRVAEAGMPVRAWNRTRDKARPLAEHGIELVDSPAAAVGGAHVVVTMLTDGHAVEAVMG